MDFSHDPGVTAPLFRVEAVRHQLKLGGLVEWSGKYHDKYKEAVQ